MIEQTLTNRQKLYFNAISTEIFIRVISFTGTRFLLQITGGKMTFNCYSGDLFDHSNIHTSSKTKARWVIQNPAIYLHWLKLFSMKYLPPHDEVAYPPKM